MACETICTFLRFFSKSKNTTFYVFFELLRTFSQTMILSCRRKFRAVLIVVECHYKSLPERSGVFGLICGVKENFGHKF